MKIREPVVTDGTAVYCLVKESTLDLNSPYAYLMLFRSFPETCAVAEANGEIVGFVSGFHPPTQPDTLFIWQVGVKESQRGTGLATRLLLDVLGRGTCGDVRYLDATVSPSNTASLTLFRRVADRLGAPREETLCFDRDHFPGATHEEELLIHIGPFAPGMVRGHNAT